MAYSGNVPKKVTLTAASSFEFDGILNVLRSTRGVAFPYTPTIQVGHSASYGTYETTHSVYQSNYWISTRNPTISITAQFTAQTVEEADYAAAALHFFKSATKGEFGRGSGNPGAPPPVLNFSAYGALHMENTPVVLGSFSYVLPEDIDMVNTAYGQIPAMFLCSLELMPQYAPDDVKNNFTASGYRNGSALNRGFM